MIATLRLPITSIAQPLNNEPPPHVDFGPTWLPLYGDVCELNMQVKDSKLAKLYATGEIDGCSFRGRILLRIKSQYSTDETKIENMNTYEM